MTWIVTRSGQEVDLFNPDADTIRKSDLIWAVGHINRFTGHGSAEYTVLQHSVHCAMYAIQQSWSCNAVRACLYHDLHEGLIGDISTPVKQMVPEVKHFERRIERVVHYALGVTDLMYDYAAEIKQADLALLIAERNHFLPVAPSPWPAEKLVTVPYVGELPVTTFEDIEFAFTLLDLATENGNL